MRGILAVLVLVSACFWAQGAARKARRRPPAAKEGLAHILEPAQLPQDFKDLGMREYHQTASGAVSVYKDRVEFHRLPPELYLGVRGLTDGARAVSLLEFKPLKVLRLSAPFDLRSAGNTILCTHPARPQAAKDGLADFCGILSPDGVVLFEFPVEQSMPHEMLQILGMAADGLYAEVFVGRFAPALDGRQFSIVEPREILAWHFPNRIKRFDGPWKEGEPRNAKKAMDSVLKGFETRLRRP